MHFCGALKVLDYWNLVRGIVTERGGVGMVG